MKTHNFLSNLKMIGIIFVASLCTAVALEIFLRPGDVIIGGALGIAAAVDLIVNKSSVWYMSTGVWLLVINVPIVIYCFLNFHRRFTVKTLLYLLFLASELIVLRLFNVSELLESVVFPDDVAHDKVIYTLIGGALHGLSLPLMLSVSGSTGGSDIVGLICQRRSKRSSSDAMRFILAANIVVVCGASVALYFANDRNFAMAFDTFVYSIAAMFIGEIVQEYIFKGFSSAVELEITTDKPEEMASALREKLVHGTTTVKVVGGYTHAEKYMVLCVLNKRQLTHARRIVHEVDGNAFAYVENVKEVIGKGFANKEEELDTEEA